MRFPNWRKWLASEAVDEPELGFRRRNIWLHDWAGLLFGWLCYVIFFTGTLSFYRQELQLWLWPEAHFSAAESVNVSGAAEYLQTQAAGATHWDIRLPSERKPNIEVRWRLTDEAQNLKGGRAEVQRVRLSAASVTPLTVRDSRFFDFIYRFHFELYAMPRWLGRWVIGIVTMMMLVILVTGIVSHRHIIADFFTFRRGKGLRSWIDSHNISGVVSLPFHLIFTYSGLLLIMYTLMPWGVEQAFKGDYQALGEAGGSKRSVKYKVVDGLPSLTINWDESLPHALQALQRQLEQHWPRGVARYQIENPSDTPIKIIAYERGADSLLNRANSRRWYFSSDKSGIEYEQNSIVPSSYARLVYNFSTAFHLQRYAEPLQRLLFFLGGLVGTFMVGSGLHIWVKRRQAKRRASAASLKGQRVVQSLNVAMFSGLPLAIVVGLWANRLLPSQLLGRANYEIQAFFIVVLLALIHAFCFSYYRAMAQQLRLLAGLLLGLFVFNVSILYPSNEFMVIAWWHSDTLVRAIDIVILATSYLCYQLCLKADNARTETEKIDLVPRLRTAVFALSKKTRTDQAKELEQ